MLKQNHCRPIFSYIHWSNLAPHSLCKLVLFTEGQICWVDVHSTKNIDRVVKFTEDWGKECPSLDHRRLLNEDFEPTKVLWPFRIVIIFVLPSKNVASKLVREINYRRKEEKVILCPKFPQHPLFTLLIVMVNLIGVPLEPMNMLKDALIHFLAWYYRLRVPII